jgi:hypothetical protein
MPTSQFIVYSSADSGSPGYVTGTSGSLLPIFDACLVDGYASKPKAGWTKPLPNTASAGVGYIGCWQQPSGSRMHLVINDSAGTQVGGAGGNGAREAYAIGWESLYNLSCSVGGAVWPFTSSVGSGSGQFPLPSQLLAGGRTVIRKSATADTTPRPWVMFADAHTLYFFVQAGDTAGHYYALFFGDIYSLAGPADVWKCMIEARGAETLATSTALNNPNDNIGVNTLQVPTTIASVIARSFGGGGQSIQILKVGDFSKSGVALGTAMAQHAMAGGIPGPNPADGAFYLSPIWVAETATTVAPLRGRMRGMWHVCHPLANFADGQVFSGA